MAPRSLDFFLWDYLKGKVLRTPPESLNVLRQRMIPECNLLGENSDLIRRSAQYMRGRADNCVQRGGVMLRGI